MTDATAPEQWGPRETDARDRAAELLREAGPIDFGSRAMAWMMVEHGRQGDLLDRLTALLPAAEAAAQMMDHPFRAVAGARRARRAAAVDLTGGTTP